MARRKPKTALSRDVEGRDVSRGAPGTPRGLAGTAGTEGANVPRRDREAQRDQGRPGRGAGAARRAEEPADRGRGRSVDYDVREAGGDEADDLGEAGVDEEGVAGEGADESGTLPGSVGGTTGTSGHAGGIQAPGSSTEAFPGLSPEEAERLRREGRKRRSE